MEKVLLIYIVVTLVLAIMYYKNVDFKKWFKSKDSTNLDSIRTLTSYTKTVSEGLFNRALSRRGINGPTMKNSYRFERCFFRAMSWPIDLIINKYINIKNILRLYANKFVHCSLDISYGGDNKKESKTLYIYNAIAYNNVDLDGDEANFYHNNKFGNYGEQHYQIITSVGSQFKSKKQRYSIADMDTIRAICNGIVNRKGLANRVNNIKTNYYVDINLENLIMSDVDTFNKALTMYANVKGIKDVVICINASEVNNMYYLNALAMQLKQQSLLNIKFDVRLKKDYR